MYLAMTFRIDLVGFRRFDYYISDSADHLHDFLANFQISPLGNVALKFQAMKIESQVDVWNIGSFLW